MKAFSKKSLILISIIICLLLCACGEKSKQPQEEEKTYGVFKSNLTAVNYITGFWTDNRMSYLYAQPETGTVNIRYAFSFPNIENTEVYYIEDGILYSAKTKEDGTLTKEPLMQLEYIDDNSFKVKSSIDGYETVLTRDSLQPDTSRTDDEYVFRTMAHATSFLNGNWMDCDDNYITLVVKNSDDTSWGTSLKLPEKYTGIDFYDNKLAVINKNEDGSTDIKPVLEITIKDKNHIHVKNLFDEYSGDMIRVSAPEGEIPVAEKAFYNLTLSLSYLNGTWANEDGDALQVTLNSDNTVSWVCNLKLKKYPNTDIRPGKIVGINEDGTEEDLMVFKPVTQDKMELTYDGGTVTLNRQKENTQTEKK